MNISLDVLFSKASIDHHIALGNSDFSQKQVGL